MNRENTNRIRFVLEDILPAVFRDSAAFKALAGLVWGKHIGDLAEFRAQATFLSDEDYEALYQKHPRVHEGSDNSEACIARIAEDLVGTDICDVGCGTGFLLEEMRRRRSGLKRLTGVDFTIDDAEALDGIEYVAAKVEKLPFADNEFDTVICTHVIEHILDYRQAISELRRIARQRVIIVVPREREYKYTFNPHFNFFPYTHSFLRAMHPVPADHVCEDIQRDIYYCETLSGSECLTQAEAA